MSVRRCAFVFAFGLLFAGVVAAPSPGTFGGTNGQITVHRFLERTGSTEIFTANPDGSGLRQLTDTPRKINAISDWSPDGQRIAFDSNRVDVDGRRRAIQVYVMNADGSNVTQITRGPGFHGFPGWSPDGTRLAIDADWGQRSDLGIWIVSASDPDGVTVAEAQRVTPPPSPPVDFDSEPQFSPDGTKIAFTRLKNARKSAIYTINVDGTGIERLTSFGLNASDPDWSPDGQRITFDSGDCGCPGAKGDIYVINADGGGKKRLTDTPRLTRNSPFRLANNPVFSPDGSKIMFTQFLDERNQVMVMNTNGSGKRVALRKGGFPNKVDWGTHPAS